MAGKMKLYAFYFGCFVVGIMIGYGIGGLIP